MNNLEGKVAIETDIWKVPGLTEEESKTQMKKTTASIPLKRIESIEDIGNCALFLVSKDASYVTESIYAIDGGMGV